MIETSLAAAREGLENTKAMKALHGRAGYYQEQFIGKQDPDATAGLVIVEKVLSAIDDAM